MALARSVSERCSVDECVNRKNPKYGVCPKHRDAPTPLCKMTCSFPKCPRVGYSKGLCSGHYNQLSLGRELTPILTKSEASSKSFDDKSLLSRLISKTTFVEDEHEDGCWLFDGVGQYPSLSVNRKQTRIHQISHKIVNGHVDPVTDESPYVLHWCGNNHCWNPDHLRSGTAKENFEDAQRHGTVPVFQCVIHVI